MIAYLALALGMTGLQSLICWRVFAWGRRYERSQSQIEIKKLQDQLYCARICALTDID